MLLHEAHTALANALGDPFLASGSPISIRNGVRYSALMRQSYLHRAMLKSMFQVLKEIIPHPRDVQSRILSSMYPSFVRQSDLVWTNAEYGTYDLPEHAAFIYSVSLHDLADEQLRPLLLSWQSRARLQELRSSRHNMVFDPMYTSVSSGSAITRLEVGLVSEDKTALGNRDTLRVSYLPVPKNQDVTSESEEELDYEPIFHENIVSMATLYAHADSQDFQELQQLAQLLSQ